MCKRFTDGLGTVVMDDPKFDSLYLCRPFQFNCTADWIFTRLYSARYPRCVKYPTNPVLLTMVVLSLDLRLILRGV
jgi:hypothetical protein